MTALGQLRDPQVALVLLAGWRAYGPALRSQALETLLRREEWLAAVLDAVTRGEILPAEIDAVHRQRLLDHPAPAVSQMAAELFAAQTSSDRKSIVEAFAAALELPGETGRGQALFSKTCAACHRLGEIGHQVGPDLAMVRDKPPEWFLPALLDPSQAVDAKYVNYVAITTGGLTLSGVLSAESGNSITLVGVDGKPQTVLRTDLEALSSSGKSAMPEGLEKDLQPQDLADLIAFLRQVGPTPDEVEETRRLPNLDRS